MLPELHVEAIHALIVQRYNIKGSIKQVAGYSDLNYLIKDNSLPPQKYIFKISCADEDEIFLNIQTYVLLRIGELRKDLNLGFPEIVKTVHGEDCLVI
jgi:Ser/Thr protein kinase RdoA (MazF antagonist)